LNSIDFTIKEVTSVVVYTCIVLHPKSCITFLWHLDGKVSANYVS